jgi:prepilin-type N-terminal cleavage/methylation domain-containing protein
MRSTKHKNGFTVVELLLALAISAMLLVAVAVAFNALIINYRQNEDSFKTINLARQALLQITSRIRTATAVDPDALNNECTLITAAGDNITYQYNNANNKLYLITNDDLSDADFLLCDNVTAMTFTKDTAVDENSMTYVKSVQISITVQSGDIQRTISAAAVVRRNLK